MGRRFSRSSQPQRPKSANLTLLWSANTVSSLGSAATVVVLPLVAVTSLRASTFQIGLLGTAGTVPWLILGLPAGVWVDLIPRRLVLVLCDTARAAALLSVPLTAALHALTLAQLYVVALVIGTGSVFFDIASQSFVPQVAPPSELLSLNGKMQASQQVSAIAGPALGGGLVQLATAPVALLLDVVSYVISAACLWRIRTEPDAEEPAANASMWARVRAGVAYVWRSNTLRSLAIMAASYNLWGTAIGVLQVPLLIRVVHLSPGLTGIFMTVEAPAAILGAVLAARFSDRVGNARLVAIASLAGPAFAVLMPLARPGGASTLFVLGAAGLAVFTVISSMLTRVYRQLAVPKPLLSRVTAVNRFLSWGVMPVGGLVGGTLSAIFGIRAAMLTIAMAMLITTPLPFFASPLRRSREFRAPDLSEVAVVPAA